MRSFSKPNSSRHQKQLKLAVDTYAPIIFQNQKKKFFKAKEEKQEEIQFKLQMTSFQLFIQQSRLEKKLYPSSFSLIKKREYVCAQDVGVRHLEEANFPVLMYKIKQLIMFSVSIIKSSNYTRQVFGDKKLIKLMQIIANNYNSISYHNFSHAFSLCLLNYQCLAKSSELRSLYSDEEVFYIHIAGLAHDLNHRGTNNSFQLKGKSQLAELSKGVSILQNMHIRTLWLILSDNPELNFLNITSKPSNAKQIITRLILNTDMAFHFKNMQGLSRMVSKGQLSMKEKKQNRWFLMEQIFHACDIGNPCNDYENYISWAALLSFEFDQQAQIERQRGMEVTESFIYHDYSTLYKDQVWFLGNIVHPIWKQISFVFPTLTAYSDQVERNLQRVNAQLQKLRQ